MPQSTAVILSKWSVNLFTLFLGKLRLGSPVFSAHTVHTVARSPKEESGHRDCSLAMYFVVQSPQLDKHQHVICINILLIEIKMASLNMINKIEIS